MKLKFKKGWIARATYKGVGVLGGTIGGNYVSEKVPINNTLKGAGMFILGVVSSEYNDSPFIQGLGLSFATIGAQTALKGKVGFINEAPPVHVADANLTIEEDQMIEDVLEGIDDDVLEGVDENDILEGADEEDVDEDFDSDEEDDDILEDVEEF